jgi:hypothetical protein
MLPEGEEDRSAPPGILGGSDNMQGGEAVARAKYCPRSRSRLELAGRTREEVGSRDMANIPPAGGTVAE